MDVPQHIYNKQSCIIMDLVFTFRQADFNNQTHNSKACSARYTKDICTPMQESNLPHLVLAHYSNNVVH